MKILVLAGALLFPLAGCATVTRGTTNEIQLYSEPSGATARTSLSQVCTTPCTLTVSRKSEFSVTFSKPGFEDQIVHVKTLIAGSGAAGFAGNVVLGGVVGMGVDAYTGATLQHVPNPVRATLISLGRSPVAEPARRGRPVSKRKFRSRKRSSPVS
ncbi:MAG: PEGA domain-containing protein [Beijerinckiaceae bacterium]|jgi:membrane-bound inhibitor of C-type lysozyme|nr:PEGA domain-containing protein [Beijerinckiaceae bacterium]